MTIPATLPTVAAEAPAEANAGRRNMALLIQLRWLAVGGQLATIGIVTGPMGISLQRAPLLAAVLVLIAINFASLALLRRGRAVTNAELTAVLLFDVAALGWQLHHSGGLANPFASLFLLQVVIGAILLTPASSWAIVAAALAAIGVLAVDPTPLVLPPPYAADPMGLYLKGSLVCFLLIAVLLVAFVTRISRNLRERDAALAASRQRAVEEDHIVRMGLLASGAAHELGTPLSTMSVLLKEMRRDHQDPELQDDLSVLQDQVKLCKETLQQLVRAAEANRRLAIEVQDVTQWLDEALNRWHLMRPEATYRFQCLGHAPVPRLAPPPDLTQALLNLLNNAADACPEGLEVTVDWDAVDLTISIRDHGPGVPLAIAEQIGKPFFTTKGKGFGLGLFLSKASVTRAGGSVKLYSHEEGGTLTELRLPRVARGDIDE